MTAKVKLAVQILHMRQVLGDTLETDVPELTAREAMIIEQAAAALKELFDLLTD